MLRVAVRCSAGPRCAQRHVASAPAFTARLDGHRRVPGVNSTASAVRHFARRAPRDKAASVPATSTPPPAAGPPPPADPWEEVTDPTTGQKYWWNKTSNETTALGAPKPGTDPWQEVRDPNTGQSYWWNKQTNETTAIGAPKPVGDAMAAPGAAGVPAGQPQQYGTGSMLKDAMVSGIGHGVGFSLAGRLMDGIMGPRSMEVVHRHEGDGGGADAGSAAPPPPGGDTSSGGGDLGSQGWSWGDGGDQSSSGGGGDGGWFGGNDQGDSGGGGGWFGGGDDEW